jgi:hypothetical protein
VSSDPEAVIPDSEEIEETKNLILSNTEERVAARDAVNAARCSKATQFCQRKCLPEENLYLL